MDITQLEEIKECNRKLRCRVAEIGDSLRERKMPELTEELFSMFERNGNRLLYEEVYLKRRQFLTVFGLLSIWYRRKEDIRKLEEVLEEICGEETWAWPAHVDRKGEDWRRTVDLFAAETGQALSQILSMLEGYLTESLANKVREMVVHRVLDSYMEHPAGYWGWERTRNNWVAVCGGSVGSAALYLLKGEPEKLQEILNRICSVLPNYIEGMYGDGVCPEGLGYFIYGMEYYVGFARQLSEYTDEKVQLLNSEKVRRVARFQQKCFLPGGCTVSFSDGNMSHPFRLGLTCYLAGTVEGVKIPDIRRAMKFEYDCYRFMACWEDDCWVQEYIEKAKEKLQEQKLQEEKQQEQEESFTFFPDAQWAIWKRNGVGAALKGGHNGEYHNHNDVGSFMVAAEGEIFLADFGAGEYTKQYFQEETRYEIFCNRSKGHNVPFINGQEQQSGERFRAGYFTCSRPGSVEMEFAQAYAGTQHCTLKRRVDWMEDMEDIVISDEISDADISETQIHGMEENLVTQIEPVIDSGQITLKGRKGTLRVELSGNCSDVKVVREVFRNHMGIDEDVWRLCWPVDRKEGKGRCVMRCRYEKHV